MRKFLTIIILFLQYLTAPGQADSNRVHYMFSFVTLDLGWGKNLNPATQFIDRPFWGTNGPVTSVSALFALKESYWGIAAQLGYTAPAFNINAYAPITTDTNTTNVYASGSAIHYNIYYLLGGIGLKLPQHTTQYAIEFIFMLGPMLCTQPALHYAVKVPQGSNYLLYNTTVSAATDVAPALSPGIGYGQKLTKHIAVMAYARILFAGFYFKTASTVTSAGNTTAETNTSNGSIMEYGNLTACISYSFGKMVPNICY